MTKPVWAPWRLEYISTADEQSKCVFCEEAAGSLGDGSLLVHAGEGAIALLNKYPYASGHLMVAPRRHIGALRELTAAEALEIHGLVVRAVDVLGEVYGPGGFNLGWNLGRAAGAGIADHVHQHVVPRWSGDTNFMPVLADVKVIPEHILETRDRLRAAWATD